MSDSESNAQRHDHATTGGKSLAAVGRPRYKSWRKKYRKMRHKFDGVLEENRKLFKEEQKLEGIARRLREELDGIMDMLLDLNQSPALPPHLRFDVSLPENHTAVASIPSVVRDSVSPQEANELLQQYTVAVQNGQIPHLDLHVIREQIDKKLAVQGVTSLDDLETNVSHAVLKPGDELSPDLVSKHPANYLTTEEEEAYLLRTDARLGDPISRSQAKEKEKEGLLDEKHWADLTPREMERQIELMNPQSQHNWLKAHAKPGTTGADIDDNESLASHDAKPARGGKGKRDLAKQVGDRAVGRAREGFSPSAVSAGYGDDDEFAFVDEYPASKKRAKGDGDSTYRVKGGKSAGGKGKRKRSGDDISSGPAGGKKVKTDE